MDPIEQQRVLGQQEQIQQAQMQAQAQQGLGTPPPAPFEYKENPSMGLMNAHVGDQLEKRAQDKQQQALAARAEADKATGGYAGYKADPSATVGGSDAEHPNTGWAPSSPEAHNMNVQLAERIKSGQLDPHTAMIAMQSPDVSPEIKQALSVIVQDAQSGGMPQEQPSEPQMQGQAPTGNGLGSVPLPQ